MTGVVVDWMAFVEVGSDWIFDEIVVIYLI